MRLDDFDDIPSDLLYVLEQLRPVLAQEVYTSDLRYNPKVMPVLDLLDEYVKCRPVAAFHCTREPEFGYFAVEGLRPLDLKSHHAWFLDRFGSIFTTAEVSHITEAWCRYFDRNQTLNREELVWFCLMPELVANGCERFFQYLGGEAIYIALTEPSVTAKLGNLGRPVVVEIHVPGVDVVTHQRLALGTLNAFHRRLNPQAQFCGVEGCLRRSVTPREVIKVWEKNDFFAHHRLPF